MTRPAPLERRTRGAGVWTEAGDGILRGEALGPPEENFAELIIDVPDAFYLSSGYESHGGEQVRLELIGIPSPQRREYVLPTDAPGRWRMLAVAVDGEGFRCLVDGVPVPPSQASGDGVGEPRVKITVQSGTVYFNEFRFHDVAGD